MPLKIFIRSSIGGCVENNFENQLDSIFLKNEYWHGNEPGQQIPFLYNYTNTPYKSSQRVRQLLEDEYEIGPGGLSGNDDAGQISAWYVFAATGFYPVNPVSDEYAVVSPLFDTISIKTCNGKTATISCKRESKSSLFIQSITLNGKPYNSLFLKHKELMNAAQIVFNLTDKPQPAKN